jgi:hypothetical protein
VPEARRSVYVEYNTHLHLDDGKAFIIENNVPIQSPQPIDLKSS